MIPPIQQTIIEKLAALCDLSPDIRMGQLLANLGFLADEFADQSLWDIEDEQLLNVIEIHHAQLTKHQAAIDEQSVQSETNQPEISQTSTPVLNS